MEHAEKYLELLNIDVEKYPVIAVVGGGGKTSLIFRLTQELLALGKKVVVTTTTHMAYEEERPFVPGGDIGRVKALLDRYGYVMAASWEPGAAKVGSLSPERLVELKDCCDVLLIEADGARKHPLKVPDRQEIEIPAIADIVISVIGLDCLGKPIRETAHRVERTAEFLKKSLDAPVTAEDVIKIASSICRLYQHAEDRVYRVYLNQADLLPEKGPAEGIVHALSELHTMAAYGSLRPVSDADAVFGKGSAL